MRVTSSTFYKDYARSVQDLKSKYNRSMEQVSTGRKFETMGESPLDYYAGKKIDNLYTDAVTKDTMIKDVMNRLEQQEASSRSMYEQMGVLNVKYEQIASASFQGLESTVDTMNTLMRTTQQTMAQDLNASYEGYYVMGGNDATTVPFTMSDDGMTLTYHHKFPGDDSETTMIMSYDPTSKSYAYCGTDASGAAMDEDETLKCIVTAMREQGRMSLGYGDITNISTLPDTYYGGLNMVTGITSEKLRAQDPVGSTTPNFTDNIATFKEAMNRSVFALNSQVIHATNSYLNSFSDLNDYYSTTYNSISTTPATYTSNSLTDRSTGNTATYGSKLGDLGFTDTALSKMNINGTPVSGLTIDSTVSALKSAINSSAAGVTASFDGTSGTFTFTSKTSGSDSNVTLDSTTSGIMGGSTVPGTYTTNSSKVKTVYSSDELNEDVTYVIEKWDHAMQDVSNTFRRIGVTYASLEEVQSRLQTAQDSYQKEYNDHMAIDTYDAIVKMYQNQFSYNAAMQVGSKIMQNSLFDFVR
ncbi:flagellin hook IN motif-containing protein [Oribacterium sp. P6A1]|uniref:flagellin hook IN motif-containing protein n=1 Tax=Oribacterium sp. P6A1 TaxID=1410612 RepID=UPI0006901E7E|nr:flagellin hook IN motif-containing protein [Oribacterium sp. P6A1]